MADEFDQRAFLRSLTHRPGVYRMLDAKHKVLYVGKARDLKKRVSSYFQKSHATVKTAALMEQAARVEVTVTNTEAEALILECNLIKQHRPRFNVLLRDDLAVDAADTELILEFLKRQRINDVKRFTIIPSK